MTVNAPPQLVQWLGTVEYDHALHIMEQAVINTTQHPANRHFMYLEHNPVITYGRATEPAQLSVHPTRIPKQAVARGGLATYHAPGQLVGYIVLDLKERIGSKPDIHAYLRAIESGLQTFVESEYGLPCCRREGFTGLWTHGYGSENGIPRKLASIGVSVRKWVTSHGFALNIDPDMDGFEAIVPCGITDAEMTSISLERRRVSLSPIEYSLQDVALKLHGSLSKALTKAGWTVDYE